MIMIIAVFGWGFGLVLSKVFVAHYFCFYLIFFLCEFENVPSGGGGGSALCPVKTLNCVPDGVICLHYACPQLERWSVSQERWFVFVVLLFVVPTSLSCSFPFVPVGSWPDGCLVGGGGGLVILLFGCVVGECFVVFCVFSFPPAVYVGTLNLIASIPAPSIL